LRSFLIFLSSESLSKPAIHCSPLFQHKKALAQGQVATFFGIHRCKQLKLFVVSEGIKQSNDASAAP
jgi:hypothetical protein